MQASISRRSPTPGFDKQFDRIAGTAVYWIVDFTDALLHAPAKWLRMLPKGGYGSVTMECSPVACVSHAFRHNCASRTTQVPIPQEHLAN